MGTEEKDSEAAAQRVPKDNGSPAKAKDSPTAAQQEQASEVTHPLNTYKWHTGSKGMLNEVKEEGEGAAASSTSTIDRIHKASTNKWTKMQNWRKALSEDPSDKTSSSPKDGEGSKAEKGAGVIKKNPFRRALSEPPGARFAALSHSLNTSSTSSGAADASGVSSTDPAQRGGGGAILQKCFRAVSQKLKRPKLLMRSSAQTLVSGNVTYAFVFGIKAVCLL